MDIQLTCTECGKQLKTPETSAGKKVKCPHCQTILAVPNPFVEGEPVGHHSEEFTDSPPVRRRAEADDEGFEDRPEGSEERRPCPMCGEMIPVRAAKCRFCGEIFDPELKRLEKKKGKQSAADTDLTAGEWAVALLCSGIGCIMGVIWLIQGKPKAAKMIGVSILAAIFWNIIRFAIVAGQHNP